MDMDQAAVFLASSILVVLAFLVILGAVLIANNLIAKYWKSWGWSWAKLYPDQSSVRFMTVEEEEQKYKNSPEIEKSIEPKFK